MHKTKPMIHKTKNVICGTTVDFYWLKLVHLYASTLNMIRIKWCLQTPLGNLLNYKGHAHIK